MKSVLKKIFLAATILVSSSGQHVMADDVLKLSGESTSDFPRLIKALVNSDMHFTAVSFIKELLSEGGGKINSSLDYAIDEVISQAGVRQFEVLPLEILRRSTAPTIRYIVAKKLFRMGKYQESLEALNASIPREHPVKPYALNLEGSAYSVMQKYENAVEAFKECATRSERERGRVDDEKQKKQYEINRDVCVAGIARSYFAAKQFDKANLSYLDIPKSSYIWPDILFEEAWNSFYLRDYNRTLGKLVTYKAPIFDFVFNPEIDVLRALTYMELCMWTDTNAAVNDFYKKYENQSQGVRDFILKKGKDYKYYYLLAKSRLTDKVRGNELLNNLLRSIVNDPAFGEMYLAFNKGKDEIEKLNKLTNRSLKAALQNSLREALVLQRDLIGSYVRKRLSLDMDKLDKAFEGMSYIKLEILGQRKNEIYEFEANNLRSRGDIANLQRTDKQYFWTFNGEFWADELGDYVFSLKSECR
ncbi:MAG: hypothetical protein Fur0010_00240 [Bdellovibrio sp.]